MFKTSTMQWVQGIKHGGERALVVRLYIKNGNK